MSAKDKLEQLKNKLKKPLIPLAISATMMTGTACQNQTSSEPDQQKDKIENLDNVSAKSSTEYELSSWEQDPNWQLAIQHLIDATDEEARLSASLRPPYRVLYDIDAKKFMEKWDRTRKKLEDLGYKIEVSEAISISKDGEDVAAICGESIGLNGYYEDFDPLFKATGSVKKTSFEEFPMRYVRLNDNNTSISAQDVVQFCKEVGYRTTRDKEGVYHIIDDDNLDCARIYTKKGIYHGKYIDDEISSISFVYDHNIEGLLPLNCEWKDVDLQIEMVTEIPEYYKNLQQKSINQARLTKTAEL